ncbi:uncharacterized protein RJT21DRAFT_110854 [Scheffersomyces amazonensis]|uniref:uncharacterized protein n=1 Tax=Scheffersomyces amazonensis TaxID=1078765 RepID=UPI00315CB660
MEDGNNSIYFGTILVRPISTKPEDSFRRVFLFFFQAVHIVFIIFILVTSFIRCLGILQCYGFIRCLYSACIGVNDNDYGWIRLGDNVSDLLNNIYIRSISLVTFLCISGLVCWCDLSCPD